MYYLATNQQLTTITDLAKNILPDISISQLLQAIETLYSRSLIEEKAGGYILQPVVIEYVKQEFRQAEKNNLLNESKTKILRHCG